ncbi:MAG: glycosyltransferase [Chloroflexi bacterium]|nr:glycosyltransferase [Chloroflexota bacterium]MCC6891431.1 glycosyltransferase [Anaerolineae bacterium]
MTYPTITLVTPSYNQAAYLEATIRSVLEQDYPALRFIIMDGGSTDGSVEIIQRYADQLTYWVSAKDAGQSDAINKGFAIKPAGVEPDNEIMTWLNSDDVLLPGALRRIGDIFTQYPQIDWLTGQPANMDVAGNLRLGQLKTGHSRSLIRRGWYHGRGLGFIRQEGTFWRRSLWNKVGGIHPALHYAMDFDLWRRFAVHAPLVTVDQHLAAFRTQPEQKTSALDKYYAEARITLPNAARLIALPLRAVFTLASWPFMPRVLVDDGSNRYEAGIPLFHK